MTITVTDIEACFKETLRKKATPHREPDFEKIKAEVGGDAVCKGRVWFIEESNTGYGGVLERWEFRVPGTKVSFWVDLLPRLIVTEIAV